MQAGTIDAGKFKTKFDLQSHDLPQEILDAINEVQKDFEEIMIHKELIYS